MKDLAKDWLGICEAHTNVQWLPKMMATVRYAEKIYYDKKRDWNKIVERGMSKDFSWKSSAKQYEELYDDM